MDARLVVDDKTGKELPDDQDNNTNISMFWIVGSNCAEANIQEKGSRQRYVEVKAVVACVSLERRVFPQA